jgi:hypothetical protein
MVVAISIGVVPLVIVAVVAAISPLIVTVITALTSVTLPPSVALAALPILITLVRVSPALLVLIPLVSLSRSRHRDRENCGERQDGERCLQFHVSPFYAAGQRRHLKVKRAALRPVMDQRRICRVKRI